jgi:hypothetical protein
MNISEEDFKKLYANLAPETQEDLKRQLGLDRPAPTKTPAEWWQDGFNKPAPSTPQSGTPIVPHATPKPTEWWQASAPKTAPQRKIKPRRKHLWKWIILGYVTLFLACVLPALLKMR